MEVTTPTGRENKKKLVIVIVILAIALSAMIYMNIQLRREVKTQSQIIGSRDVEIASKAKQLDQLRLEYERIREERQALGLSNDSLDAQITKLDIYISKLKKSNHLNEKKRKELEELVAQLQNDLIKKDSEILRLVQNNDSLAAILGNIQNEKIYLGDSLTKLYTLNRKLADKITLASILKSENITLYAINSKGKEKKGNQHRSRNIDKIKLVFNLGENNIADFGPKEIMICIIDANGATIYDLANGGGIFDAEGKKTYYTTKQTINFDNSHQQVTFIYKNDIPYSQGDHLILLYADGFKIGETRLRVR